MRLADGSTYNSIKLVELAGIGLLFSPRLLRIASPHDILDQEGKDLNLCRSRPAIGETSLGFHLTGRVPALAIKVRLV